MNNEQGSFGCALIVRVCSKIEAHYQYNWGCAVKMKHIVSKYHENYLPRFYLNCTDNVPQLACTTLIVLIMCLNVTTTLNCTDNVNDTPSCTDNVPQF